MPGLPHAFGSENPSMRSVGADRGSARAAQRRLAHDLRTALSVEPRAQLFLVYQPVMDVVTGVILGQEALIRWAHPVLGELQPGRFIPMAEAFGLIWQVGEWVLRAACLQAAEWPSGARVAVNLSPHQLVDPRLVTMVLAVLAETGLDASRLELEVSERVAFAHIAVAAKALASLREHKVRILLDDFGTEGANLARLLDLPLDGIKIDRAFLAATELNADARSIIRAVLDLAGTLGLDVVAEGVETEEQLHLLTGAGCRMVQGFLFQRPLPPYLLPAAWRNDPTF